MNSRLDALLGQAARHAAEGDLANAQVLLTQVLAMAPRSPDALSLQGIVAFQRGDVADSLRFLRKAVKARPADAMAHYNVGNVLMHSGDYPLALESLERAVRLGPGEYWIRINHGVCLSKLGRFEQARASLRAAIDMNPTEATGWYNLALCLEESGNCDEALTAYDQAIRCKPDYANAWSGKGSALHKLGRFEDALPQYDKAIECDPGLAEAWANKGGTLHELQRLGDALACFDRGIEVDPGYADSYWNLSLTQLLMGDFERGWLNYRYRWKVRNAAPYRHRELPELDDLKKAEGHKILVWAEQGLGDTLQFSRYVPLLVAQGTEVVFEVDPELHPLLKDQLECSVVPRGTPAGRADFQVPLLQLPMLFNTRLETIPADVPYLRASPEIVEKWRLALDASPGRLHVGICCSGNRAHNNDARRSMPLALFRPVLDLARCYLLQKEVRESDRGFLQSHPEVRFLGDEIGSFEDTAGIVRNLDVILSVDTSLAHLAGALGTPVHVLLPWAPDWRWLKDRTDSPWYPTARLFRQPSPHDWSSVMTAVAGELTDFKVPSA